MKQDDDAFNARDFESPTGKSFDIHGFGQTSRWEGDRLIVIAAFWGRGRASATARSLVKPRDAAPRREGIEP